MKVLPTCTTIFNADGSVMTLTVYVKREESAKNIDVDISTRCLKLVSEQ
jgi:hypothetical protein